ncbi:hypothetical protein WKK05_40975 (plasmid) [Nostoc sp. UHCC 0302]|uniref:hypothetical protein n=1 Tax=Nostoc sp. UHCC 0302 TaxID=3134896 RepID=UPI00311C99D6
MSYTKELLQQTYSLSAEDVDATLTASGLPIDQSSYSDQEIQSRFDVIRALIQQGKTYKQAAAHFQRQEKKRAASVEFPPMNIVEMLVHINSEYGIELELTEAIEIMTACGLSPNQKEYRQLECERFLEACDLILEQGQSHQQVAAHFGVVQFQDESQQIADFFSDEASVSEDELVNLVNNVTLQRAQNIPGLVNQMYLKNVIRALEENKQDIKSFYTGLEQRILERIEGKSRLKTLMGSQWHPMPLPHSSPTPMLSPNVSESRTSTD